MKVESSIKESYSTTTTEPLTKTADIVEAICEWHWIDINKFNDIVWPYRTIGKDNEWNDICIQVDVVINPIGKYLMNVFDGKEVVFEKWNDKFFGRLEVRAEQTKYQLWDKVIDIPFRIRAKNEDTGESMVIFPKTDDIIQRRMKGLYVVNTGWAERQKIEKEIMAKMIELAQIKGGNEIISTQSVVEELQKTLEKRGIKMEMNGWILLHFWWRYVRDTAWNDGEYFAPPIKINIDFDSRFVKCQWYSSHWFGTPNSWWNPCWWNLKNDIYNHLNNCDLKELVNLIVNWAYGYNSNDTWMSHDWRHPLAKLRDYIWYAYERKDDAKWQEWIKENLEQIKADLNIDDWLDGSETIKEFLSTFENKNEASE